MAFKYLFFLLSLTSCLDKQEIRNSSSGFDELNNNPNYEYITYLNFENESLVVGHKEEIEQLSTTYNLDVTCVNQMLIDYLNFIRNDKQNYSDEFIEDLKYHYVDLYDFEEENLNEFFKAFDRRFTYLLEQ